MRIAVVGANGRTGHRVVETGLARGHRVTAVVRRPEAVVLRHERLTVARADVLDRDRLVPAMAGCDAVVSTLGVGASRAPTEVYSRGVANILAAMAAHGIATVAVVSALPVGSRDGHAALERIILLPILQRLFGATYDDMRRMETVLRKQDVQWVALRPPRLVDRPTTGGYRVSADGPLPKARRLTHADLALALLDSLEDPARHRRAVFVAQ